MGGGDLSHRFIYDFTLENIPETAEIFFSTLANGCVVLKENSMHIAR